MQQLWHGEGAGGGAGLGEVMPWKLQQKQRSLGAANPVFAGRCCGSARGGGGGEHQGGGTSREGCERCFRQTPACSLVSSGRTSRQLPAPPPRCGLLSAPTGCDEFLGPQRCPCCRQGYDGGLHAHSLPGTGWGGGGEEKPNPRTGWGDRGGGGPNPACITTPERRIEPGSETSRRPLHSRGPWSGFGPCTLAMHPPTHPPEKGMGTKLGCPWG